MQAYRIVDWVKQYEVTIKKRATKAYEPEPSLDKLRKSPLPYVRISGVGHAQTTIDRRINEKAWRAGELNEAAVFGLYVKLVLIAANQPREFRGWVLDQRQNPMYAKQIAETLGYYEVGRVSEILSVLCDPEIELVSLCEFRQTSGQIRTNPEGSGLLYKTETETEENINKTKEDSESPSIVYASVSAQKIHLQIADARAKALKEVLRILRVDPNNQSDLTTFRDIFDQFEGRIVAGELTVEIFDAVVDEAVEAGGHRFKKIARFVNAMKLPRFGYMPVKRIVFDSKYR